MTSGTASRIAATLLLAVMTGCGGDDSGPAFNPDRGEDLLLPPDGNEFDGGPFTNVQQQAGGVVHACAVAVDGSGDLYIGGNFRTYNDQVCGGIRRLNADGTVDPSFNPLAGFGPMPALSDTRVQSIAPALDGSGDIYVAGDFTTYRGVAVNPIVRLNADGGRDLGFAAPAMNGTPQRLVAAVDGSGDIYVLAFEGTRYNGALLGTIARLNADGSVDGGFVCGAFGPNAGTNPAFGWVYDIATVTDGSGDLIVLGAFTQYGVEAALGILRLNPDGTRDPAFVGAADAGVVLEFAQDGTGDMYVGGGGGLVRLNANGAPDAAFSAVGLTPQEGGAIRDMLAAEDGGLILAGEFRTYAGATVNGIVRLNAAGAVVPAGYGTGFSGEVRTLAAGPGGSVYAGGSFAAFNGAGCNGVCRLDADGTLDAAGFAAYAALDRYPDRSSAPTGGGTDLVFATGVWATCPAADGSGDIYVGGEFAGYEGSPANGLVRLNANGTRDAGFAVGAGFAGTLDGPPSARPRVQAILVAPDGDVYAGGDFATYDGVPRGGLIRFNADGSVDQAFTGSVATAVRALAWGPDGAIYVGTFAEGAGLGDVVRLFSNGTIDPEFNSAARDVACLAPSMDGSGDVYVGGPFAGAVVRLNEDGTVDAGFATAFGSLSYGPPIPPRVEAILPTPSGDLFVGGYFQAYSGAPINSVARLNADGTRDRSFVLPLGPVSAVGQETHVVRALALAPNGDLYVAGRFTYFNGEPAAYIAQVTVSGQRVATFAQGGGFSGEVRTISRIGATAGDLYVGGDFRWFNNVTAVGILRLNAAGSID